MHFRARMERAKLRAKWSFTAAPAMLIAKVEGAIKLGMCQELTEGEQRGRGRQTSRMVLVIGDVVDTMHRIDVYTL